MIRKSKYIQRSLFILFVIELFQLAHFIFKYSSHLLHQLTSRDYTHYWAMSWYTPNYLPPNMFSIVLANSFTFNKSKIYLLNSFKVFTILSWFFFAWARIFTRSYVGLRSNIFLFGSLSSSCVLLVKIEHNTLGLLAPNYFADGP